MNKKKKELILGASFAAGLTAAGGIAYASTKWMVDMALDRKMPGIHNLEKVRKAIRGGECVQQATREVERFAKALRESPHEIVEWTSHDGQKLVGHWFPVPHPKRIILAMHGWRSSWNWDFGMVSNFWQENDCSVLFAEQRGQGSSGGTYMGFGMLERYDCLDWIHWLEPKTGGQIPVYLVGISMGASTVLMATGLQLPECVAGVIADCGFTSAQEIWKHVARKNLHLSYRLRQKWAGRLCQKKIHLKPDACSTVEAMKQCQVPVLFVHGTADRFVPLEMTLDTYQACAAKKRLLVVPGADHGMSYYVDREAYQNICLSFWQDCEQPETGK